MNSLLKQKLINLGLSTDEVELYILLLTQGAKTGSEIRNELSWGASKVDAVIYQLIHKDLISAESSDGRVYYRATELSNLETIIHKLKEKQLLLERKLTNINFDLQPQAPHFKDAKILQYHGINGLKQVLWNATKAKELIQGFEYLDNAPYLDFRVMDDIWRVLAKRNVKTQSIMNFTSYGAFTNVTEYLKLYECRYIDPTEIEFHHEVMIYNDVYTIFRADKNGIFCTEIYNQKLVDLQKQLFKYIWNRSQKLKMGPKGELSLIS